MKGRIYVLCCVCPSERNERGEWNKVSEEHYAFVKRTEQVSHGYCPPCAELLYDKLRGEEEIGRSTD